MNRFLLPFVSSFLLLSSKCVALQVITVSKGVKRVISIKRPKIYRFIRVCRLLVKNYTLQFQMLEIVRMTVSGMSSVNFLRSNLFTKRRIWFSVQANLVVTCLHGTYSSVLVNFIEVFNIKGNVTRSFPTLSSSFAVRVRYKIWKLKCADARARKNIIAYEIWILNNANV